jgi:hypothetical protein
MTNDDSMYVYTIKPWLTECYTHTFICNHMKPHIKIDMLMVNINYLLLYEKNSCVGLWADIDIIFYKPRGILEQNSCLSGGNRVPR